MLTLTGGATASGAAAAEYGAAAMASAQAPSAKSARLMTSPSVLNPSPPRPWRLAAQRGVCGTLTPAERPWKHLGASFSKMLGDYIGKPAPASGIGSPFSGYSRATMRKLVMRSIEDFFGLRDLGYAAAPGLR